MSAGTDRVVVIGAGVGGLAAAARLGQLGFQVEVLEARNSAGGFASSFEAAGLHFDAGPYVLLDRPGLDWAFSSLQADLSELIELRRIDQVYEVRTRDSCVKIHADLEETARGLDRSWPGVGKRYERFVESAWAAHRRLAPSLFVSRPGLRELLRGRSIGAAGYLWRSLGSILASQQFPRPVRESLAIWTQIAGQRADEAPGPMAFVPALIHKVGAFYPVGGFGVIPAALERLAREAGVSVRFGAAVRRIRNRNGSIEGVETSDGERIETRTVLTDSNAVGVYAQLLDHPPRRYSDRLTRLPMQSPGTCAYLSVQKASSPPYLEFRAPGNGRPFRLLVLPSAVDRGVERERPVSGSADRPDPSLERRGARRRRAGRISRSSAVRRLVERTSRSMARGCATHSKDLGLPVFPLPRKHEPGDDKALHAGGARGSPQSLLERALLRRFVDASWAVG